MTIEDRISLKAHHHSKRQFFQTKTFRLLSMVSLTFTYFLVELIVGKVNKSNALVADSFHMLSDVISLVIAIVAVRISKHRSDINTYGWVRAEVVGANINTVFLLALCLTIVFDAIRRFITPEPIENVNLLLIVGSVGLGINIIGLFLFQGFHGHSHGGSSHGHSHTKKSHGHSHDENSHGHSHDDISHGHSHDDNSHNHVDIEPEEDIEMDAIDEQNEIPSKFKRHSTRALEEAIGDCAQQTEEKSKTVIELGDEKKPKSEKKPSMNMHGVFLHVLADALGSVVVIISALLIKFVPHDPQDKKHWTVYIDPTLSVLIIIIITISTIPLFKETSYILLQTIPRHLEINRIKSQLLENVREINGIHELHVWRLTDEKIIATAHLNRKNLLNYMSVADKVKKFFHSIGIHSVTMQYECDDDTNTTDQPTRTTTISDQTINDPNEENQIADDCLLRCENEECDTQSCCPKSSEQTNTVSNINYNNNNMEVFAISQPTQNENFMHTEVSVDPSV